MSHHPMKDPRSETQTLDSFPLFPLAKKIVRRGCRSLRFLTYRAADKARVHTRARFVELPLNPRRSSFFGYYDRSPWNANGDILFQETTGWRKRASLYDKLELRLYRAAMGEVVTIGETNAWNWQQGCMLQWLGPDGDRVIYNAYSVEKDDYYSAVYDLNSGRTVHLDMPIYCVNPQGTSALTLDFSRLARLRPDYGYFNKGAQEKRGLANDGIWQVDLNANQSRLILSLRHVIKFEHSDSMGGAEHRVNHIAISPDGKRFMFLHRWTAGRGEVTRLLTADMRGENLYCLANDGMVSHCAWKNEKQILSWARQKGVGDRYFLFTDRSSDYEVVGEDCLREDGHPSFSPDRRWLLTDTYPDARGMSSLLLFDTEGNDLIKLGDFLQPPRFRGEIRCDLHPRWSLGGNLVAFDSCHSGRRRFHVLDVSEIVRSA